MAKSKQDPQIEWGFHAVIPRMVRTSYEKLTPVQKWLYVCLKDLCGEHGTCYRALRVLAEETGVSTGMLSESVRSLHDAGLIHAEKKRRSLKPTAKEVWHITIVDIWQANAKEHPTKRSPNEHYKEENVHTVNNNVQQVNNTASKRSAGEQKRSHSETEEESLTSINIEAVSLEEEDITISASAENGMPALIHLEVEKKKRETDPHIPVIRVSSHSQGLSESTEKGQTNESPTSHSNSGSGGSIPGGSGEDVHRSRRGDPPLIDEHPIADQDSPAPAASTVLVVSSPPPTSGVQQGAGYGHTPPKPRLKKTVIVKDTAGPPPFPSESEAWGTTTCLHLFDFWRGAPLCDLGQLKYASSCAKKLAETYNRKQVVIVRTAMNNQKFWKEQGGADVCDVARHMGKELNKLKMPTAPVVQVLPRPTLEEVECIDPTWNVYQRPGDTQEWILWQGELLTEEEANDRGYAGGGGLYIQTQYA